MTITFPSTKATIDAIRGAIGRDIEIYTSTLSGCPACSLDPITNQSTNVFCTVCSGVYWIPTYTANDVLAHITWGNSDNLLWVTGGQLLEGDCRISIEYTVDNLSLVDDADYFVVDGKKLFFNKKMLRGVPAINRILVDLKEERNND